MGKLQWFKLSAGPHPLYSYEHVPYVAWRFKDPTDEARETVFQAVSDASTETEWTLDTSRRNWILAPARILRKSGGADSTYFYEIVQETIDQDQDFCRKALRDFDMILEHLEAGQQ
jgi:hypothetical protein